MDRLIRGALAAALVLGLGCERLVERQVTRNVEGMAELEAELLQPGVFEVVLCGTSAPLPNPDRAQACTAVFANGHFLVFDIGDGAQESMEVLQLPVGRVDAVFLSHFHNDHFADLGELIDRTWIFGRREELPIHGPEGVVEVVDGFVRAYGLEYGYRTAHHGPELMPPGKHAARGFPIRIGADPAPVIWERDGVRVRGFLVDHEPVSPAFGFVVEYDGRRLVISGDTDDTPALHEQARGADVLVSEVMNKDVVRLVSRTLAENGRPDQSRIMADVTDYHIDGRDLARLAEDAGVKTLVLTHLVPSVENSLLMSWLFHGPVGEIYTGTLVVGEDGTRVTVGE